jgi:vacuolar protein sorting-associated protein 13A/C
MSTASQLQTSIISHYSYRFLTQLHKVLGSIEVLGNPVNLFSNVSAGVGDFFYEPYRAITKDPEEVATGVLKGTTSLFKSSLYGVTSTTSQIGESLTKGKLAVWRERRSLS